jgi:hypothetical protein
MIERSKPMTVTFTQTGRFTVHTVTGNGAHTGYMTCCSDEDMMMAIGRFVWLSLDAEDASLDD